MSAHKLHIVDEATHKPKKKKRAHGGGHEEVHEGEGPWIVSYADMMTLLFCFFVIMTSFASFEPQVVAKKSAHVAEHFVPGKEDAENKALDGLGMQIGGLPDLKGKVKAEVKDGQLQLVFSSAIVFDKGDVNIKKDFLKNIDAMIGLIKSKNPNYRILVEGHTDNSNVKESSLYRSNWEISSARSASVIERFAFYGFKPIQLVSVGYGDSRPVADNFDKNGYGIPANQALNRRVVVKILKPLKSTKLRNLEMQNYFEDSEILSK